jgi:PAS domain S-box-containing protein
VTTNGPVNVLLVDDEPRNLVVLEAVLEPLGLNFVRATSGEAALRHVLDTDFAAILLDVRMPTMSGFEAAKLVRSLSRSKATPIIFLTASEGPGFSEEEAYGLGAVDFLTKPVSPTVLKAKVGFFAELYRMKAAERQRAEEDARSHRQLTETVVRHMPAAVALVRGSDLRFQLVNPAYAALAPGREMVGRTVQEVWPELQSLFAGRCRRVLETGEPFTAVDEEYEFGRPGIEPAERRYFSWSMYRAAVPGETGQGLLITIWETTDRKRAEEEFRRKQAELTDFVENATVGLHWVGPDGIILWANKAELDLLGYSKGEYIGRHIAEFHADPPVISDILCRLTGGEELHGYEARLRCKDGSIRHVLISSNVSRKDGAFHHTRCFTRDITDRKRAEEALRRSEARNRAVVETALDCIIGMDQTGRITEFNPAAERTFGYRRAEVLGREMCETVIPPDYRDAHRAGLTRHLATGEEHVLGRRLELSAVRKGGERFACELSITRNAGEPPTFTGFLRDITERKRAEESIIRSAEAEKHRSALLHQVAESSRSINAVLSVDGITRVLSEEARHILGTHVAVASLTRRDDYDQVVRAVSLSDKYAEYRGREVSPDGLSAYVCRTNRPLRLTQAEVEAHPEWDGTRGGEAAPLPTRGWLGVPLTGHGGKNLGLIQLSDKAGGDFAEEDEAILGQLAAIASVGIENARLYDSLREQDQRKDEFLATLAHELRNPLAPVRTGLQVLKLTGDAAQGKAARDMMERQIQHMVRLVDDLMDVSRVSRGKVELRPSRVTVRAVFDSALETSLPLIEAARHELSVSLPEEPLYVRADLTRVAQVLGNLLNNAAKYTPERGRIGLSAARDGDIVVIRVKDDGTGIPGDMLPKVFDLFTQVGRTIDRSQGGLGIGLSLVRRLVELHGGTVVAESPGPGKGSTFTVRLPLAPDEATEIDDSDGLAQASDKSRPPRRVLVVDDNVDGAESLALLLQLSGHQTRTAHSGPEALTAARVFRPDIVFLGIGLPGMNGYEVATRFRREAELRDVALVALTGWGSEEDRKRSLEAGFDFHLTKPVEVGAVENVLSRFSHGR